MKNKNNTILELVQLAYQTSAINNSILSGAEKALPECCSSFTKLLHELEINERISDDDMTWGYSLLNELKREPCFSHLLNLYYFVLIHWDILQDNIHTYRLLFSLTVLDSIEHA